MSSEQDSAAVCGVQEGTDQRVTVIDRGLGGWGGCWAWQAASSVHSFTQHLFTGYLPWPKPLRPQD